MDNEGLINNIKSSYILKNIFTFIPDTTIQDKLFLYSKKLQNKFNIKLIELKEKYLTKIGFILTKYLKSERFDKFILIEEYHKFLKEKNINKEKLENIIYDIYENKKIEDEKVNYEISIYSPLFKILYKTKNFENFTIQISQINIDKYILKDDYINLFNELNNINIKYTSILYELNDIEKINYLKEIKIDFKKIKRITLKIEDDEEGEEEKNKIFCFFNYKK